IAHLVSRIAHPATLRVRNRIYARVFDREWVARHMPDAEIRRQRAAYRRGLARAAALSAVVVAAMAGLTATAVTQAGNARAATRGARPQARETNNALAAKEQAL